MLVSIFSDELDKSFDKQLKMVKEFGIEYVSLRSIDGKEISDFLPSEFEAQILPQIEAAQIKVSSLSSSIGRLPIEDEQGFEIQKQQLDNLCRIANLLSCRYIRIFSFLVDSVPYRNDYEFDVLEKLRTYCDIAAKYGVVLLHENKAESFGNCPTCCQHLMKKLKRDNLKSIFDFGNFIKFDMDTMTAYEMLKDHVWYFHIKDMVKETKQTVICGTGDGRIEEILSLAKKNGFDGFVTIEAAENIDVTAQHNALKEILHRIDAT